MKLCGVLCANLNRNDSYCFEMTQTESNGVKSNQCGAKWRNTIQKRAERFIPRHFDSRKYFRLQDNISGGKTDNKVVTGATLRKQTSESDVRLQHAYAYFLLHFKEIAACVQGGCSVKSVWRGYVSRASKPFPGSYSAFLRYCRKHNLARGDANGPARPPSDSTAVGAPAATVLQPKRYPPPRTRPPGIIPNAEDLEL